MSVLRSLSRSWKQLAATDTAYKLASVILLSPLLGLLLSVGLFLSGQTYLSDEEILAFFLSPSGFLIALLLIALWSLFQALEHGSLLMIIGAEQAGEKLSTAMAVQLAIRHAGKSLRLAGRVLAASAIITVPFLLLAWFTYKLLLTKYDINYYLAERPPEFIVAVAAGGVYGVLAILLHIRVLSSWILAMPCMLLQDLSPKRALQESTKLVTEGKVEVYRWLAQWAVSAYLLHLTVSLLVSEIGRFLIPSSVNSLAAVASRIGSMAAAGFVAGAIVNGLTNVTFAALVMKFYRDRAKEPITAYRQLAIEGKASSSQLLTLNWKRAAAIGIIALLGLELVGFRALDGLVTDDDVKIMAHRGASVISPENTMAAFEEAINLKADWIELDVQESSDGQVVVMHDSDLMRLGRQPIKIWNSTWTNISEIDIGSWKNSRYSDQRVPLLIDVLEKCRNKIGVVIELKDYGHNQMLETRVIELVEAARMESQVMIMSLNHAMVKRVKDQRPEWKCGLLLSAGIGSMHRVNVDFYAVNARAATTRYIDKVHELNKEVFVWTVDDPTTISLMMSRGVDGILTNKPDVVRQVLAKREEMTTAERLSIELAPVFGVRPKFESQ